MKSAVELGAECPKEVPVHRQEVFDAIHKNDVKKPDNEG